MNSELIPPPGRRPLLAATLLAIAGMFLVTGCESMIIRLGQKPDTAQLEKALIPRVSTTDDVRAALGPAKGRGRVMLPTDEKPRDLWYYYYEEATLSDDRRIFLFVFLDGDRYDGYLWFSSLPGEPTPATGG